jgi:hypothetical protein
MHAVSFGVHERGTQQQQALQLQVQQCGGASREDRRGRLPHSPALACSLASLFLFVMQAIVPWSRLRRLATCLHLLCASDSVLFSGD